MSRHTLKATIHEDDGRERQIAVHGRYTEVLPTLIDAGAKGVTAAEDFAPGVRVSSYIHRLRVDYGLAIETRMEQSRGQFGGEHARYVLRSRVTLEPEVGRAAA